MVFVTDCSVSTAFYVQYNIQKKEYTMIYLFSYVQYAQSVTYSEVREASVSRM